MYSKKVLDHFHNPRNVGEIENPTAAVEVTNPACGDVLRLSVTVRGGAIVEVRFKAAGCVPAIACGSWLADWLMSKPITGLPNLSPQQIEAALDALPPASKHAALLASDALRQLAEKVR